MKRCTLVFPREIGRLWLAKKKLKVGAGLLNGWGGKFDSERGDKTLEDTARREFAEESGAELTEADSLEKVAVFDFYEAGRHIFECHIYFIHADSWVGRLKETDEMGQPEYFDLWGLPFERMMPADKLFVKRLLDGERIRGRLYYSEGNKEVLDIQTEPLVEAKAA
jgi:8-oxo-dGTP diphosphatase